MWVVSPYFPFYTVVRYIPHYFSNKSSPHRFCTCHRSLLGLTTPRTSLWKQAMIDVFFIFPERTHWSSLNLRVIYFLKVIPQFHEVWVRNVWPASRYNLFTFHANVSATCSFEWPLCRPGTSWTIFRDLASRISRRDLTLYCRSLCFSDGRLLGYSTICRDSSC